MYYLNLENTGLENDEQVIIMADMMRDDGYNVMAAPKVFGNVNSTEECPVNESVWEGYLELAVETTEIP